MQSFQKKLKKKLKCILNAPLALRLLSKLLYYYALLVGKTTRWQTRNLDNLLQTGRNNQNFILIGWHGRALMMPYFSGGSFPLDALVSLHQDGRIIDGLLRKFGLGTIGGSSNRNAKGAAMSLMRSLQEKRSICIIPDGPRGPRMKMTMSPIYYAQKTGLPIHAMVYSVKTALIINKAWDKMMFPAPFSKGICLISDPFFVPADAGEAELENYRCRLENLINELSYEADKTMGREPVLPETPEEFERRNHKRR